MSNPTVWSAAACCRFRAGGLLPLDWQGTGEKQASRGKAAASRRTPKNFGNQARDFFDRTLGAEQVAQEK